MNIFRVIDVGSEWRTFSNEKADADPSRVGAAESTLLNGTDLTTIIGPGTGNASFDENGVAKYQNRRTVSKNNNKKTLICPKLNYDDFKIFIFYFQFFKISFNSLQMRSSDRALINAVKEITSMADKIHLQSTIVERAKHLFKQVHDGKNLKGRSNDATASACLYIACRYYIFYMNNNLFCHCFN